MSMFQKATKAQLKARIALDGPSGSGKTFTALQWARILGDRIALVDTERGSASLYSDLVGFDTLRIAPPYDPARLIDAFKGAESEGYEVIVVDSLSHFWDGEGGFLDIADAAGQRAQGNSWAGWKTATPQLRHLIDVMLGSELHVICTMRSRTEWAQEEYTDGSGRKKTKPVRIGMAPVMRSGMEYEFTLVGDLDLEHRMTVSKSRCAPLADLVIQPGRFDAAEQFKVWLSAGEPVASRNAIDSLKDRLNAISDRDARVAAKKAFADQFGNPDFLLESKVAEADAFLSALAGSGSPAGGDGPAPPSEPQDEVGEGTGDGRSPAPTPTPTTIDAREAQQLHRDLGRTADKRDGYGIADKADHEALIFVCSNGRTTHAAELTPEELGLVYQEAGWVKDGRRSLDDVRRVAAEYRARREAGVAAAADFDERTAVAS